MMISTLLLSLFVNASDQPTITGALVRRDDGLICRLATAGRPDLIPNDFAAAPENAALPAPPCGPEIEAEIQALSAQAVVDPDLASASTISLAPLVCLSGLGGGAWSAVTAIKRGFTAESGVPFGFGGGVGSGVGLSQYLGAEKIFGREFARMVGYGALGVTCTGAGAVSTYVIHYLLHPGARPVGR